MSVGFGNVGISDEQADYAYATSFGNLKSKTVYQRVDPLTLKTEVDYRQSIKQGMEVGMKAFLSTSGGTGTAGYVTVPVYVDPRIVDQSRKYTPLVELLPRVSNQGVTADYVYISSKNSAFFAAEDGPLAESNDTVARGTKAIRFLYAVGRVSGPAMAAVPPYVLAGMQPAAGAAQISPFGDQPAPNAMQKEVLTHARALKEKEEDALLNGDNSSDANSFDGIIILLGSTNRRNPASGSGGVLALSDIDVALQDAFDDGGRPDLAVCNSASFRQLQSLLSAKMGYLQPSAVTEWGFSQLIINGISGPLRVIPSMQLSNGASSGRLIFLDTSIIEVRVLQDLTYEELAKTNDSQKFMLKEYLTLVIKAPAFCSQIYQISVA